MVLYDLVAEIGEKMTNMEKKYIEQQSVRKTIVQWEDQFKKVVRGGMQIREKG